MLDDSEHAQTRHATGGRSFDRIEIDDSGWPIVVIRYPRHIVDGDWVDHLWIVEGFLRRRTRFCVINDSRTSGAANMRQRRMVQHFYWRREAEIREYWRGTSIVTSSSFVAASVRWLARMSPPPHPWMVTASYEEGRAWVDGKLSTDLRQPDRDEHAAAPPSPRELAIVEMASQGKSNKEVAYALGISASTVASHFASLRAKLGAESTTQVLEALTKEPPLRDWPGLTEAERDVVAAWVEGESAAEIANTRGTSVGTVRAQVRTIYRKLSVSSRSELLLRGGGGEDTP
jgi:DNA-binding NarL/FixJ family response regulator